MKEVLEKKLSDNQQAVLNILAKIEEYTLMLDASTEDIECLNLLFEQLHETYNLVTNY